MKAIFRKGILLSSFVLATAAQASSDGSGANQCGNESSRYWANFGGGYVAGRDSSSNLQEDFDSKKLKSKNPELYGWLRSIDQQYSPNGKASDKSIKQTLATLRNHKTQNDMDALDTYEQILFGCNQDAFREALRNSIKVRPVETVFPNRKGDPVVITNFEVEALSHQDILEAGLAYRKRSGLANLTSAETAALKKASISNHIATLSQRFSTLGDCSGPGPKEDILKGGNPFVAAQQAKSEKSGALFKSCNDRMKVAQTNAQLFLGTGLEDLAARTMARESKSSTSAPAKETVKSKGAQ